MLFLQNDNRVETVAYAIDGIGWSFGRLDAGLVAAMFAVIDAIMLAAMTAAYDWMGYAVPLIDWQANLALFS